ncbi:MAG: hypothetical protein ACFCVF_03410 [Kineosporiaceae bacterium]
MDGLVDEWSEDPDEYASHQGDRPPGRSIPPGLLWVVSALVLVGLVAAVAAVRGSAQDPAAAASPPPSSAGPPPTRGASTGPPPAGPPLTLDGWGSVRLGGPDAALARVRCGESWCPEPLVDAAVDARAGCVQRLRPGPVAGGVSVWVWARDGRVEAVGVVGSPTTPQETPLGEFGDDVPGDGSPGSSVRRFVDGVTVTVAALTESGVDYAEVATDAGRACAAGASVPDVQPPGPGEPRVRDRAVDGVALGDAAGGLAALGWQDVSFGDAPCRTWLAPSGAVAYSRAGTVVGLSARAVDGGPAVGDTIEEVTAALPDSIVQTDDGGQAVEAFPWGPAYDSAVVTGAPPGRLALTTVRSPGVVEGVDWPVWAAAGPAVVTAVVVGESCEEPAVSDHRTAFR